MAWMNMLYRTYEANAAMAGKADEEVPLSLVSHMTATAQIEIIIDTDGNFISAAEMNKDNARIIIPVTEGSASRSSGIAPHALCDFLSYIAGDFSEYLSETKAIKKVEEKFSKYFSELSKWNASEYAHEKVKAIQKYISKMCMMSDLIKAGIVKCEDNGKLPAKTSDKTEKALVCFRVQGTLPDACWQDKSLFESYIAYYASIRDGLKDICYLTGEESTVSTNHPKGIVAANYGAKLISANDNVNFVYRGRFEKPEQAYAVSYEATQKAHSALTWLAAKQGVVLGAKYKRTYICWNPNGKKVVKLDDPLGFEEEDEEPKSYTEERYKERLLKTIQGYRNMLDDNDEIVIIGLDAATTGRLSVTYYNELRASDFYDRIEYWGNSCNWYFTQFDKENKPYTTVLSPFTKNIITLAFGAERGALDDKLMKEQVQRIYGCILDGKSMPYDIVNAIAHRASNPQNYSRGNYEKLLSTACAVIKKYYADKRKESGKGVEIQMELDEKITDRNILFGMLLAVAEAAEYRTFSKEDRKFRQTNAMKYMSVFESRPESTWKIIQRALQPYFKKLGNYGSNPYKEQISEIYAMINKDDLTDKPLNEKYLAGFYLKRREFKEVFNGKAKQDNENTKSDENKEEN